MRRPVKSYLKILSKTLKSQEIADLFGVSTRTVRRWKNEGISQRSQQYERMKDLATGDKRRSVTRKRRPDTIREAVTSRITGRQVEKKETSFGTKRYIVDKVFHNIPIIFFDAIAEDIKHSLRQSALWLKRRKDAEGLSNIYFKVTFRIEYKRKKTQYRTIGTASRQFDFLEESILDLINRIAGFINSVVSKYAASDDDEDEETGLFLQNTLTLLWGFK